MLDKIRAFTLREALVLFSKYFLKILFYGFSLWVALALSVEQGISRWEWILIVAGALILTALDEFSDYVTELQIPSRNHETAIYKTMAGAIEHLIREKESTSDNAEHYFSTLLRYIERVVEVILHAEGKSEKGRTVAINANLMVYDSSDQKLHLRYFGTPLAGREPIELDVRHEKLLPGAPAACAKKKVIYIPDTQNPKYSAHFNPEKDYRSIVSVPILISKDRVIAVVNIDSELPEHFDSETFIRESVMPRVKPFINLIALEKQLMGKAQAA